MSMCDPTSYARNMADLRRITRRHFFSECGVGVGKIALASLMFGGWNQMAAAAELAAATQPTARPGGAQPKFFKGLHFPARAKHVIYLFMAGAPSQLDLFDNKPTLVQYDGHPVPESLVKDQRYAFIDK